MEKIRSVVYGLLRIVAGGFYAVNGGLNAYSLASEREPLRFWIRGVIEFVGGLAVALGVGTRWAALCCGSLEAVAAIRTLSSRAVWETRSFPILYEGEHAILYCLLFFFIACTGSGRLSLEKT